MVLALPFSILRSSVDYSKAGFSPLKRTAIEEQGMGTNSKLHLQFTDRHWESLGSNGDTFADTGYQNTWDVTRASRARRDPRRLHGRQRSARASAPARPRGAPSSSSASSSRCCPGSQRSWNGRATLDFWPGYPWTKGSYSYWKVGQYTKFAGVEREPEGACHFAGEHTSIDFQGYLNGAVETGEKAAAEVRSALR